MGIVPKGPRANVRDMEAARAKRDVGGRPSGLGYDPAEGSEFAGSTYREDGESDVFSVVGQRGYSEHRFYTRSVNSHNHGEKLNVRVPQGLDSQLYAVVREIHEYRHINDLVRDALVHRLEYLQKRYKLTDDTRRLLELERLTADSERRSAEIDTMTATVANISDKLKKAWEANDFSMFAQELEEADEIIDWLRNPYKQQVVEIVASWKRRGHNELERIQQLRDE